MSQIFINFVITIASFRCGCGHNDDERQALGNPALKIWTIFITHG